MEQNHSDIVTTFYNCETSFPCHKLGLQIHHFLGDKRNHIGQCRGRHLQSLAAEGDIGIRACQMFLYRGNMYPGLFLRLMVNTRN